MDGVSAAGCNVGIIFKLYACHRRNVSAQRYANVKRMTVTVQIRLNAIARETFYVLAINLPAEQRRLDGFVTRIITMKLQAIRDYKLVRNRSRGISHTDAPLTGH